MFRALEVADPDALAMRIATVETSLRSGAAAAPSSAQLGAMEEVAYVQLALQPSWQAHVLAALSGPVRAIAQANLSAAADIDTLNGPRAALPAWRIEAAAPAAELIGYYKEAQRTYGVGWQYLAAINLIETGMGRIHGTSTAGAQGPMQFLPATWAEYGNGGNINDPSDAILAAARYLQAHGAPGDMRRALFAYNPTNLYVDAVTRYAQQMDASLDAFYGYYAWPVLVSTTRGYALLPEGFSN